MIENKDLKLRHIAKAPKYIWLGIIGNCAMIRRGNVYYRHAGEWFIKYGIDDDGNYVGMNNERENLNGIKLIATNEYRWRQDNSIWAPKKGL